MNISILSKSISKLIRNSLVLLPNDSSWNSTSSKLWTDWNWLWPKNDSYVPSFVVRNGLTIQIHHPQKPSIKLCKISLFSRNLFWYILSLVKKSIDLPTHKSFTGLAGLPFSNSSNPNTICSNERIKQEEKIWTVRTPKLSLQPKEKMDG